MALLAAESFNFADREALHSNTRQRLLDLVEFERLYDRLNLLHKTPLGGICRGRFSPNQPRHLKDTLFSECNDDISASPMALPGALADALRLLSQARCQPNRHKSRLPQARTAPSMVIKQA